eukprot:3375249-Pyramimonas_sp.AAC.1
MRVPSWPVLVARLLVQTRPPSRIAIDGARVEWESDRDGDCGVADGDRAAMASTTPPPEEGGHRGAWRHSA